MKKMQFSVRCVRACLVRHGVVYTARGYNMCSAEVWVDDVGRCYRRKVAQVRSVADLRAHVGLSGFSSAEDWWRVLQGFVKGGPAWLYEVRRLGAGPRPVQPSFFEKKEGKETLHSNSEVLIYAGMGAVR